ncbi:chromate transporter [Phocaeicola coprocola]|uniref:chromate transporter n=2 Tax=Phocaeicola coprocola TaxID=310298 RepID=UPI0026727F37
MIFLQLFYTFFKIGLFGFGGGYAMISMIQGEVVTRYEWLSSNEFTDIIAISQMTPGPIGINSATYVGYSAVVNAGYSHAVGILGSTIATVSVVLPSFILMVLISKFFLKYQKHPIIASVFEGLRPGVVGLLAAAALVLMNRENFGTYNWQILTSIILFAGTFIASYRYKVNPILLIVICGIIGYVTFGYILTPQ